VMEDPEGHGEKKQAKQGAETMEKSPFHSKPPSDHGIIGLKTSPIFDLLIRLMFGSMFKENFIGKLQHLIKGGCVLFFMSDFIMAMPMLLIFILDNLPPFVTLATWRRKSFP